MNREKLDGMTLEELYRTAAEMGLREAPGLPREAVVARLLGEPLVAAVPIHEGTHGTHVLKPPHADREHHHGEPRHPHQHHEPAVSVAAPPAPQAAPAAAPPVSGAVTAPPASLPGAGASTVLSTSPEALALVEKQLPSAPASPLVEPAAPAAANVEAPAPAPAGHQEPFGMLDLEELPEGYGVDECELIAKDPFSVFVYWEVTADGLAAARRALSDEASAARLVMRLIATAGPGDRGPERETRDHALDWNRGRRYFPSPRPGARVRAAVGLVTPSGLFAPIAHSSQVRVPPAEPAAQVSAEWMEVRPPGTVADTLDSIVVVHRGPGEGERGVGVASPGPQQGPVTGVRPHQQGQQGTPAAAPSGEGPIHVDERERKGTSPWRWRPGSQN